MLVRYVFASIFAAVIGMGGAIADPWSGTTYNLGYGNSLICMPYCSDTTPPVTGSAVDLSNAYIGIGGVVRTSYGSTGTAIATGLGFISLNQFASASSVSSLQNSVMTQGTSLSALQGTVSSQGQSILNLQAQDAVFAAQMTAVTKELALISNQIADLADAQRATEKHAWIGSALASALVAVSPAEGKTNRLGMNMATVQGQSAMGLNYAHVSGGWDLNAGVAVSTSHARYVEGRVGFGFSW